MTLLGRFKERIARQPIYKRLLRNMSWLLSVQILGGLIGVVTLAMMARALGPAGLGLIAILEAYTRIVDRLTRLEPWMAVIRFGLEAREADDQSRFRRLIKASILIDLCGSLVAGGVALGLAALVGPLLNVPPEDVHYLQILSVGLFLTLQPTGIAILRIHDRFDLLAKLDLSVILLRFVLVAVAFWFALDILAFVLILLLCRIATGLLSFVFGLRLLRAEGHDRLLSPPLRGVLSENPGFLAFLWNSNINVILRQSTQRFDVLILSALTNPAIVGSYYLARRLSEAALKFVRPLNQAVYPELVRLWTSGSAEAFRKLVFKLKLLLFALAGCLYLPLVWNMADILSTVFGEEFRDSALLVSVQLLAVVIYLGGASTNASMLTVKKDRELVRITFKATVLFFVLIVPLIMMLGAVGLAINHLVFNMVWLIGCTVVLKGAIDARVAADASVPPSPISGERRAT